MDIFLSKMQNKTKTKLCEIIHKSSTRLFTGRSCTILSGYYVIVNESPPPSIGFFYHTSLYFVYRNAFLLKKISSLPSFRAI